MNEINQQLKQLALEAQQYPAKTKQRQQALTKLLKAIQQSAQLVRPRQGDFLGFYEEIYAEALQRLFFHICERIDDYDPQREVLQWANFLLNKRFFVEASRAVMPTLPKGVNPKQIKRLTIDDLDRNNPIATNTQENLSLFQEVFQCLESDPEGIFKGTHICEHPAANFQFLAIKILSGYSWKEISAELGIKIPTLSSFYQRCLTKFAPKFKDYLS
ncbi:MAG TPA: sigma-70 family RNA polymerase sigma factor [Coleofasciculaceae cyanobacterium]